jgi:hypothetical protein
VANAGLEKRAKELLDRLAATPRFAGTTEEARGRAICRAELEACGFECRDKPFEFSDWPARWGPPLVSLSQAGVIVVMTHFAAHGEPATGLVIAAAIMLALVLAGRWVRREGVLSLPYGRSRATNLEATRGNPAVWLVAHLDSKSQTVPMLARIASAVTLQLVSAVVLVMIIAAVFGAWFPFQVWILMAAAGLAAAIPGVLCFVRNASPGAVDNATGVVATLLAATHEASPKDLGVLITSAEELGLAGARAWVASADKGIRVVNSDTIDDEGGWRCMYTGARPSIAIAAESVCARLGTAVHVGRLIPGILADNIAFSDVGVEAVTISRGNFSTLARIHTWRDTSIALTGRGAAQAGVLISALAKELS